MKKFIASLLIAVPTVVYADAWTIVSVTKFLIENFPNSPPTQKVRVKVEADSPENARQGAFREACNQTWGSSVITDRSAVNGRLATDRIASSSSCFVKNYTVLSTDEFYNRVAEKRYAVEMEVTTSPNSVDGRLLGESTNMGAIQGDQHQASIQSLINSRQSQDKLIQAYFNYYPEGAYDINVQNIESGVNNRQSFLKINYEYKFSYQFMHGLWSMLDSMKVKPQTFNVLDPRCSDGNRIDSSCALHMARNSQSIRSVKVTMRKSGNIMGESDVITLNEGNYKELSNSFQKAQASIQFSFLDGSNNVLMRVCDRNIEVNNVMLQSSSTGLIRGDRWETKSYVINLSNMDLHNLKNYHRLETKAVRNCIGK
jgi:hypothetical protein